MTQPAGNRLLVFGSGFIASHMAQSASDRWGWKVDVVYRHHRNPTLAALPLHALPTQLPQLMALLEQVDPTHVLIASGSSFVPAINRDVQAAMDQHLNTTLLVLDALARLTSPRLQKVLTIGSASEYGAFPETAVDESHLPQPRDAYGMIKLAQRQIGLHFSQTHGLPVVHIRQFNVTGVGQDQRFVLPSICRQVALLQKTLQAGAEADIVAGNTTVRRDFLAIDDVCEAYRVALTQGDKGAVYNVCSGTATSIDELIAIAARISRLRLKVQVNPDLVRESDKAQAVILGDPSRLRALGWAPNTTMPELLERMIAHYATAP